MAIKIDSYLGNDLGANYTKENTVFKLWAPLASDVSLCLYSAGDGDCLIEEVKMISKDGVWTAQKEGNLNKTYYTYKVNNNGVVKETVDPYAKAVGVNGIRSMVIDLSITNPDGFDSDKGPKVNNKTDLIVTEISVVDNSIDESANSICPGKYPGLSPEYFNELGVTHVQLMPSYDFGSIDEASDNPQYNWGYDPVNYNVPEGSYSTDPFHGEVRIKEFKEMVQRFHKAGLGVIMDVVYNHTYNIDDSCFQKTVPDYYYRKNGDKYSDASACGNEFASDMPMASKYIIDSLCYWAKEYHIDGFRFDLMGVLDIDTMNKASRKLHEINPDIVLYGEGWTGGDSTLNSSLRALKVNDHMLHSVGMFSDDIRDAIKGHVFDLDKPGFVNGATGMENDIMFSVCGAVEHPQVDYDKYTYTNSGAWAKSPEYTVNYVSCHDNLTLWDKFGITCPKASDDEKVAMNKLAAAIVFTSQGIPFFLTGEEMARTKPVEGSDEVSENSYNLPVYTNAIHYDRKEEFIDLWDYYKGLIEFRKAHKALKLDSKEKVANQIKFLKCDENMVVFTVEEQEDKLLVAYNANDKDMEIDLPLGKFDVCINHDKAGNTALETLKEKARVVAKSCLVAVLND